MLQVFRDIGCNMSIKLHCSHLDQFPDNLGEVSEEDVSEEQKENFHQDLKTMEDHYHGRWTNT